MRREACRHALMWHPGYAAHGQDRAPCCDAAADFLPVRDHGFARAPSAEGAKKHRRTPTEDSHVAGFKPLQAGVTNAKAFPDGRTRSGAGSEELGRTTEEWTTASKLKQSAGSQQKVSTEIVNLPKLGTPPVPSFACEVFFLFFVLCSFSFFFLSISKMCVARLRCHPAVSRCPRRPAIFNFHGPPSWDDGEGGAVFWVLPYYVDNTTLFLESDIERKRRATGQPRRSSLGTDVCASSSCNNGRTLYDAYCAMRSELRPSTAFLL